MGKAVYLPICIVKGLAIKYIFDESRIINSRNESCVHKKKTFSYSVFSTAVRHKCRHVGINLLIHKSQTQKLELWKKMTHHNLCHYGARNNFPLLGLKSLRQIREFYDESLLIFSE